MALDTAQAVVTKSMVSAAPLNTVCAFTSGLQNIFGNTRPSQWRLALPRV